MAEHTLPKHALAHVLGAAALERCWQQGCLDEQLKEAALLQHPKAMISLACELHVAREVVDLLVVQQASMIEVRINPKGVHISPAGAPCHSPVERRASWPCALRRVMQRMLTRRCPSHTRQRPLSSPGSA